MSGGWAPTVGRLGHIHAGLRNGVLRPNVDGWYQKRWIIRRDVYYWIVVWAGELGIYEVGRDMVDLVWRMVICNSNNVVLPLSLACVRAVLF